MEKWRFEFKVKSAEDPKSNIICITSITDVDKQTFLIPDEFQPVHFHEAVLKTQAYQKVKATLKRRHEKRFVWIPISAEIKDLYMDQDGNMQYKGYLLEEFILKTEQQAYSYGISEEGLSKIMENFAEMKKDMLKPRNIKNLSEKFVIEKFNSKTSCVSQWIGIFEAECVRVGIDSDVNKIEILRLFLEDSCQDWYSSMLIKHTINSEWATWKQSFCETYADKGWSPVRYAILYKYRQGTLLEYALKKERLLLEINKSMNSSTIIDLIATGLPNFIADRIDRHSLKGTENLFNSIRGLEHLVNKKNLEKKTVFEGKTKEKNVKYSYTPCQICEKEKRGIRYHPESLCWFKNKNADKPIRAQIRSVNNSELETELNAIDPKN